MFPVSPFSLPSNPWLRGVLFVASAAAAAMLLRVAWEDPVLGSFLLLFLLGVVGTRWLQRRKLTRLLHSGDVGRVLDRWGDSFDRVPHPETMGPLLRATAFAAYGWVEQAREALAAARRGPAWEAALEHRLFLDTMIATFDGEREAALEKAERLERLPLPDAGPLSERIRLLRTAIGALARAFAHRSRQGDIEALESASEASPLIHWAMRYGAAVVSIDHGDKQRAMSLIAGAPEWPEQSTFRAFHQEIVAQLSAA